MAQPPGKDTFAILHFANRGPRTRTPARIVFKRWYGAKGKYHECFMYPSNLYKQYNVKLKKDSTINIQVGNSADPTNNHIEAFEMLRKYKHENVKIYVPLSYGNQNYASTVISKGGAL